MEEDMRTWSRTVFCAAVAFCEGCASTYRVIPVDSPPATVRYEQGVPTTNLAQRFGAVQVTPMQFEKGRLVFGVAAYNRSDIPVNFGVENIKAGRGDRTLRIYTIDDLIREARNEAIAASVALALLGAAAAAASEAAAHQTYKSTFVTPSGGVYRYKASYYDRGQAVAGAAASIGAAGAGIYAVNRNLDAAIAGMGNSMLQTTTIDPGETIGGRVIVQAPGGSWPREVAMLVSWNGENYPFRFLVTKNGETGAQSPAANASPAPSTPPPAAEYLEPVAPRRPIVEAAIAPVPAVRVGPQASAAAEANDARPERDAVPTMAASKASVGPSSIEPRVQSSAGQRRRPSDETYVDPLAPPSYLEQP
jgi:hypothetical protein